MINLQNILGFLAVIVGGIGYTFYLMDIFKGKTKPHAFSWAIWGILEGIAFAAQLYGHGGPGAWVTGITSLLCFVLAVIGFYQREIKFIIFDWISLTGAGLAILLWWLTKTPLFSVILVSFTDAIGFLPTFRKSYYQPFSETVSLYELSILKLIISLFALSTFSLITALYPLSLIITNSVFVTLVLIRRKQIRLAKI